MFAGECDILHKPKSGLNNFFFFTFFLIKKDRLWYLYRYVYAGKETVL